MSKYEMVFPAITQSPEHVAHSVTACIGRSDNAETLLRHASSLAKALAAPLTMLQVLNNKVDMRRRPDPTDWDLRRHEAKHLLTSLSSCIECEDEKKSAEIKLAEGQAGEEICLHSQQQPASLMVLGLRNLKKSPSACLSKTINHVLHKGSGSVMLIPSMVQAAERPDYKHIVVLLDGSPWAERVLPLAIRLSKAHGAELILVHAVPSPELTRTSPYEPADLELRKRVVERNAKTARQYLDRICSTIRGLGLNVRVISVAGDDVRATLVQTIETAHADLVLLSARGHGLGAHAEMPYGGVTAYLLAHSTTPMLVMLTPQAGLSAPPNRPQQDIRFPASNQN